MTFSDSDSSDQDIYSYTGYSNLSNIVNKDTNSAVTQITSSDDDDWNIPQQHYSQYPQYRNVNIPVKSHVQEPKETFSFTFLIKDFQNQPNEIISDKHHLEKVDLNLGMIFKKRFDQDFNEIGNEGSCFVIFSNFKETQTASFLLRLVNFIDSRSALSVSASASCSADSPPIRKEFTMSLGRDVLQNPRNGWINTQGEVKMEIHINFTESIGHHSLKNDSKKLTGYVGLKNQGATCYMNSMLQALYHLPAFRRIVYKMDTRNVEDETKSIPLNLQRLFCQMQFQDHPCSTKSLTKSFGWSDYDSIMQHDIQEFCRLLVDNLEMKMKGTELEQSIPALFKGQTRQYIRCINVEYESSKIEDFYDLSMQVKGCKTLQESFEKYVEKDRMDGNNQYSTDDYGKQDADMGVEFISFPSVLHLHLRRFEFDYNYETMIKINDRFEFPEEIDLTPYLSKDSEDISKSNIYDLYGVLIHMGAYGAGHYYAFLRTSTEPQWYRFDDDFVTKVEKTTAIIENFGGDYETTNPYGNRYYYYRNAQKSYSAYMLVYIRREKADQIFEEVREDEIPRHLLEYVKRLDQETTQKKEQKIGDLASETINVITQDDLERYNFAGKPGFPIKPSAEHVYKLDQSQTLIDLYNFIANEFKVDINQIRIWDIDSLFSNPKRVLPMKEIALSALNENPYLKEITVYVEPKPIEQPLTYPADKSMVLFVKFYFPDFSTPIQYIGSINLSSNAAVEEAIPLINQLLGFPENTPLLIYTYTTLDLLKKLNNASLFVDHEVSTGSFIICQVMPGYQIPLTSFVCKEPIKQETEDTLHQSDLSQWLEDDSDYSFSDDFSDDPDQSENQQEKVVDQQKENASEDQNEETVVDQQQETTTINKEIDNVIDEAKSTDDNINAANENVGNNQKKEEVPLICADVLIPTKVETVDKYLDKLVNTVIADVYDYNDQSHPLFSLQFVSSIHYIVLKQLIAHAAGLDYNPEKDSLYLYINSYQKQLKQFGNNNIEIDSPKVYFQKEKRKSIYFKFYRGISENEIANFTHYQVEFSKDGYNIDQKLDILARKHLKTDELLAELKKNGVDVCDSNSNNQYRFYLIYDHKLHNELQPDQIISPYYPIRIEIVPQDQLTLNEIENSTSLDTFSGNENQIHQHSVDNTLDASEFSRKIADDKPENTSLFNENKYDGCEKLIKTDVFLNENKFVSCDKLIKEKVIYDDLLNQNKFDGFNKINTEELHPDYDVKNDNNDFLLKKLVGINDLEEDSHEYDDFPEIDQNTSNDSTVYYSEDDDFTEVKFQKGQLGLQHNEQLGDTSNLNQELIQPNDQIGALDAFNSRQLVDSVCDERPTELATNSIIFKEFLIEFCYVYSTSYGHAKGRGDPFFVKVIHGETFENMKKRILSNLKEPQLSRFQKSKFELSPKSSILFSQNKIINDDDILSEVANSDHKVLMIAKNQKKKNKKKTSYSFYESALKIHN